MIRKHHRCDNQRDAPVTKVMKYTVAMRLQHLGVRVEARIAELSNLLGQQLDTACRVAEYDRLIDL